MTPQQRRWLGQHPTRTLLRIGTAVVAVGLGGSALSLVWPEADRVAADVPSAEDPTSLAPRRHVSGVKPLRHRGSGAWKGILVSGCFETSSSQSAVPRHRAARPRTGLNGTARPQTEREHRSSSSSLMHWRYDATHRVATVTAEATTALCDVLRCALARLACLGRLTDD